MGDADSEVIQVQVHEIETWMDEALGVVDEGFENLLTLVTLLNDRTKNISQEIKLLKSFRETFIALNAFVVPVVIAIMLCYGTNETVKSNKGVVEVALQNLVTLLMFLGSCVGLPFYVISVWEVWGISEDQKEESIEQSPTYDSFTDDSLLTLMNESSWERVNEFARLLEDRMPQRMRSDLLGRRSAEKDASEVRMADTSETEMESSVTNYATNSNSAEPSEEKEDDNSSGPEEEQKKKELPMFYEFEVLMSGQSPDLAVQIKPASTQGSQETGK